MKRLVFLGLVALLPFGSRPAIAANPLYNHNLIVNGGAEAGEGLPGAGSLPGWDTLSNAKGGMISVQYNYDGYPKTGDPGPKHRGTNFFAGGTNAASSHAGQQIDVSAVAADIDARALHYAFEGYLGGSENQADYATATVEFFDAGGTSLGSAVIGAVTVQQRHGVTGLWYRVAKGSVPVGTRSIQISINAARFVGSNNDGYLDELSLILRKQTH
jgi:hypothetical protein